MMGSETHPLDPGTNSSSDQPFTLIASSANNTHPLLSSPEEEEEEQAPAKLFPEVRDHESHEDEDEEVVVQVGDDEDDEDLDVFPSRIISTAGTDRLIHHQPQLSSSSSEFLNIIVTQPQKEVDSGNSLIPGGNYFVTYLVSARTNIPEFGTSECSARRRFKDIVALADSLVDKYRGLFIPSRPEKSIVESQIMDKHDFVELRRVSIEKYLRRLASHPVLRKSEELRLFLLAKGKLPLVATQDVASRMLDGAAKLPRQLFGGAEGADPQEVVHSARGGRDLMRLFKELRKSVTNDWGGSRPPVGEEDKEFVEKKEQLREYERKLAHAAQQSQLLLKAQEHMASVTGDHLGLSLFRLAKLETQSAAADPQREHAGVVRRMANAIVKTSRLQRAANAQAGRHLEHLQEHLAVLQSAQAAFSERDNALLTLQTLLSDISLMQGRAEKQSAAASKIFGGDRSRSKKIDELNDSIRVTEEARRCAEEKYNQIKDNNRVEIERVEAEKHTRFLQMLHGFVHSQISCAEKISKEWNRVVDESDSGRRVDSPVFKTSQSFHG